MHTNSVNAYYEGSERELARRYLADDYPNLTKEFFDAAILHRYQLYPHIPEIAAFTSFAGKNVLEVGIGQGIDHSMFAKAGANLTGVDITDKHCRMSRHLLATHGLESNIVRADARELPFADASFDHVYSCGVLLLFPEIDRALEEIRRVLRPGGSTTIMLYNKRSIHYYIKTLMYCGFVLREDLMLGHDTMIDWYTDGIGYIKTYHYGPSDLSGLFSSFRRVEYRTDCLTREQLPEIGLPHNQRVKRWLENRFGFFLWIRAWV
ncbi:MAG: class I SAM-dependent methyltransferase [Magnetospirillum sp.]|nr:MAG: class I SAM-dependent methyltransferase [Magnetospirillum sp.]